MSWHFSQALEAAYCAGRSSDGVPSVLSRSTPLAQVYSQSDKMMAFCRRSRSGMMCAHLTASHGEEVLTWWLEVFLVKTLASRAKVPELLESEAGYGSSLLGSFAKYDRATRSWKTVQHSLFGGLETYSRTWPRSGLMQDGVCWERPMLAHGTYVIEFGLLPTPTASTANKEVVNSRKGRNLVAHAKRMVPTPAADDSTGGSAREAELSLKRVPRESGCFRQLKLRDVAKLLPTPAAANARQGVSVPDGKRGATLVSKVKRPDLWPDLLPTPTVCGNNNRKGASKNSGDGLATAVKQMVPTPTASMVTLGDMEQARYSGTDPRRPTYADANRMVPTPTAGASKGSSKRTLTRKTGRSRENSRLDHKVMAEEGGQLNPVWVEWLMGWPMGWTDLSPYACDRPQLDDAQRWDKEPDGVGRVATSRKGRVARIHALGGGQVPQCAAAAWRLLTG